MKDIFETSRPAVSPTKSKGEPVLGFKSNVLILNIHSFPQIWDVKMKDPEPWGVLFSCPSLGQQVWLFPGFRCSSHWLGVMECSAITTEQKQELKHHILGLLNGFK